MGPGLFESWYLLSTSLFLPAPFRLSRILLQEERVWGMVGCGLEMEKEGRNGSGREAGADMATDSQRPLGSEAFFTDGGQRRRARDWTRITQRALVGVRMDPDS